MKKKMALVLVLFMVGSWCVFADESDTDTYYSDSSSSSSSSEIDYTALWISLAVIGGVGLILVIVCLAAGDYDTAQDVNKAFFGKADPSTDDESSFYNNPIVKHTSFGVTNDKVYVGASFSY
jgi:hypothetical protein